MSTPRGASRWAKSCPIDSFETSGGSGDADRSAGGTSALDRFVPFAFAVEDRPLSRTATSTAAIRYDRSTSIRAVRVPETDVAHRVHMLRRKFVRRVLVAVGAARGSLRRPFMRRVSALAGQARDDPVGAAVRYALERPSTPPDQESGGQDEERRDRLGAYILCKRGTGRAKYEFHLRPSDRQVFAAIAPGGGV